MFWFVSEPVELEIENIARLALHGHAEPAAHLPRLRRLVHSKRRGPRASNAGAPVPPEDENHVRLELCTALNHAALLEDEAARNC